MIGTAFGAGQCAGRNLVVADWTYMWRLRRVRLFWVIADVSLILGKVIAC
jgi:hypothetical protein